jgi:hypothetical protein
MGGGHADRSVDVLGIMSRVLFLGSSRICPTLLGQRERLSCTGTAHKKRTSGVCGLAWKAYVACVSGFPLQGVHRFESPRLSDMSNRFSCSTHLVANLMELMEYWFMLE